MIGEHCTGSPIAALLAQMGPLSDSLPCLLWCRAYVDNRVYNVKVKVRDRVPCDDDMKRALALSGRKIVLPNEILDTMNITHDK